MLGAAAELERALIRERSIARLKAAVARGKEPSNPGLRRRDPAALEKARRGREMARDEIVIAHAQNFLPTVEALRPTAAWDQVVRVLKGRGRGRPWDGKPWTPNSLIWAVRRLAVAGLVRQEVLNAAPKRIDSDDLAAFIHQGNERSGRCLEILNVGVVWACVVGRCPGGGVTVAELVEDGIG